MKKISLSSFDFRNHQLNPEEKKAISGGNKPVPICRVICQGHWDICVVDTCYSCDNRDMPEEWRYLCGPMG